MQRMNWWIGVALTLGAASATAQEMEWELAEDGEARLEVELGASTTRAGFAISIAGGVPFSHALLELATHEGASSRALIALDGEGRARFIERNWELERDVEVTCSMQSIVGGAAVVRSAIVPAASNIVQPPPAQLGTQSIVITEFMKDPSFVADSAGEWIEIRNMTNQPIDLEGWVLSDAGSNLHTIHGTGGVIVPQRSYFVLGINANPTLNGGVQVGYKYSNFSLGNSADEIRLTDNLGTLVDVVSYDNGILWPSTPGKSISLNRAMVDTVLNDDGANWCSALASWSASNTDSGTPRVANNTCP